jgi:hypothetical protein
MSPCRCGDVCCWRCGLGGDVHVDAPPDPPVRCVCGHLGTWVSGRIQWEETEDEDGRVSLEPQETREWFRCEACGHRWSVTQPIERGGGHA